ncbi:MAG TPA: DUF5681 domain-containing protein [Rhizomicrobium sp.]|nr:DUF5681 domain-containing protein [Rhizomicrobium sp.]
MTTSATYAVGRGKPPLHTRFKKGQSGNPSGKPGPAKLAKARFQRALLAALEGSVEDLAAATPATGMDAIVQRVARDATEGRIPAVKLVLSQLDKACAEDDASDARLEAELVSLLQGKAQGSGNLSLEDLLWPGESDFAPRQPAGKPAPAAPPPARNEAAPVSLPQGKTQGNGKIPAGQIVTAPAAAARTQTGSRSRLMTGAAALSQENNNVRFGMPPPA